MFYNMKLFIVCSFRNDDERTLILGFIYQINIVALVFEQFTHEITHSSHFFVFGGEFYCIPLDFVFKSDVLWEI